MLESKGPRSEGQQGQAPSEGSRGGFVLPLPAPGGFLGIPWLVAASLQSLPLLSHDHLPCVCVCVQVSTFL